MVKENFNFLTRHSKKFKEGKGLVNSEEYSGITPEGVELARKTTEEELKPMIDALPNNSVMALIGASDAVRTKSTAKVYGDTLKQLYKDDSEIIVETREEIADQKESYSEILAKIKSEIGNNLDKKFIINFPLFIKEFSMVGRWLDKDGNLMPYCEKLLAAVKDDDDQALVKWVESNGEIDGIKGPDPNEVARAYEQGFNRLRDFANKNISDRPVYIGGAGHSWDMDAFIAYMTHGKVDNESIKEIMGENEKMIKETEPFYFSVEKDTVLGKYRGKDYNIYLDKK